MAVLYYYRWYFLYYTYFELELRLVEFVIFSFHCSSCSSRAEINNDYGVWDADIIHYCCLCIPWLNMDDDQSIHDKIMKLRIIHHRLVDWLIDSFIHSFIHGTEFQISNESCSNFINNAKNRLQSLCRCESSMNIIANMNQSNRRYYFLYHFAITYVLRVLYTAVISFGHQCLIDWYYSITHFKRGKGHPRPANSVL